jgi:uncharacterized protein (TIGR00255 family)
MIQSMTGFGKATVQIGSKKITVELKSLNSKGIDLNVRLPYIYREKELGIRNEIAQKLERGKIDCTIFIENTAEETTSKINVGVMQSYIAQLKEINPTADETELMKMAIRIPDSLKIAREEIDENEWAIIHKTIGEGIENIINFRTDEGKSLDKEFQLRIANIRSNMFQALELDPERVANIKGKLRTAIDELKVNVDENRFEQELIYYLEKLDISEEKVRLNNHLDYFLETINEPNANGRKLGFITQEMGREINTMGSKSNHAEMQKLVVMMKDELEKIKEQVLNVL